DGMCGRQWSNKKGPTLIKGHSRIRSLLEMMPLSNSQLLDWYPTVTEPKRAFAPPFQLTPMTGPILERPEGIRRKDIAVQITATKTTGVSIVNASALGITVRRLLGSSESFLGRGQISPKLVVFTPHLTRLI